jgi:hypothetical protein
MNKNIVELSNIYMEDVFEWLYNHVMLSSGDGCGQIVCSNYQETARYFEEWALKKDIKHIANLHQIDNEKTVLFTDMSNENFVFSSEIGNMYDGDYTFLIKEDCHAGWSGNKVIKKYE